MSLKYELTRKTTLVDINDVQKSTKERPILGVSPIATNVAVLLYNEKNQIAVVANIQNNGDEIEFMMARIFELLSEKNILFEPIKYKIIQGPQAEKEIIEKINKYFNCFMTFEELKVPSHFIKVETIDENKELKYYEFAFNSSTGRFVTDNIYFGEEYYNIINDTSNKGRKR